MPSFTVRVENVYSAATREEAVQQFIQDLLVSLPTHEWAFEVKEGYPSSRKPVTTVLADAGVVAQK